VKETSESVSDLLFPHQYRRKVLALLLLQPGQWLHLREIARLTVTAPGTLKKELDRLQGAGLLEVRRVGNQTQFSANRQHPIFQELSALLRKTVGLADVLVQALMPAAPRIAVAFVFGSVARAAETAGSDVDVMLIGELDFGEALNLLYDAQAIVQREINPKVFSAEEWRAKLAEKSSFVLDVLAKPKIFLIGNAHDLDQLAQSGQDRAA
jgi:predicted nucleotidyltransferase